MVDKEPDPIIPIDPPAPLAPIKEWRAYLASLRKLPRTKIVRDVIQEAEEHIRELEADRDDPSIAYDG